MSLISSARDCRIALCGGFCGPALGPSHIAKHIMFLTKNLCSMQSVTLTRNLIYSLIHSRRTVLIRYLRMDVIIMRDQIS